MRIGNVVRTVMRLGSSFVRSLCLLMLASGLWACSDEQLCHAPLPDTAADSAPSGSSGDSDALPCVLHHPTPPANPFASPAECQLRPELKLTWCGTEAGGVCSQLRDSNHWCQYGACGPDGKALCAPYEVQTIGVPFGVAVVSGCEKRCRVYLFTEDVCGTTDTCEAHDAGYDLCAREHSDYTLNQTCQLAWDCWVEQNNRSADWCAWMTGRAGPSGFTHLLPYAREKGSASATLVPFYDVVGSCPPDRLSRPVLPPEFAGLTVKRAPATYFASPDAASIPGSFESGITVCTASLDNLMDYAIGAFCPEVALE